MDNQFRRGEGRSYPRGRDVSRGRQPNRSIEKPKTTSKDDEFIIDLYDDVPEDFKDQSEKEVEELKKLAQSDALRAYAWAREQIQDLGSRLKNLRAQITPRHIRLAKIGAVVLPAAALILYFAPGIYSRFFSEDKDILGQSQTAPEFDVLESQGTSRQPLVFDPETNVAVYQENINGVVATVSQQPLPANFQDVGGLEGMALSLNDKVTINHLQSDKGAVYVAITTKDTNVALFTHQDLLVFISTNGLIDNDSWIEYVNGLN